MALRIEVTSDTTGAVVFTATSMDQVEKYQAAVKNVGKLADAENILRRRERLVTEQRETVNKLRESITAGLPNAKIIVASQDKDGNPATFALDFGDVESNQAANPGETTDESNAKASRKAA